MDVDDSADDRRRNLPGRPANARTDPTMRYIARRQLFAAVALQCGITAASVRAWKRVPPHRVIAVEKAIGRSRHLIRPDLHPN